MTKYEMILSVYHTHSISVTAEKYNYTQSAISQAIKSFEKELGFPLFKRTKNGMLPISNTEEIIREELATALFNIPSEQAETIVIAYEPIWAIGTGAAATAVDAQAVAHFIRGELTRLYGETIAEKIRILYGGSVKAANIEDFMAQKDIDGGLIGGASLKATEFKEIYEKV